MKRFAFLLLASMLLVGGVATVARAQQAPATPPMTDEMVAHIRDVCSQSQVSLGRLHASDALLRVNQGQAIESITSRLMTPFNSRMALDQLDSGPMATITSALVDQFDKFRSDYQSYEEATSRAMQMDCVKQPVAFYDAVNDARTKRVLVHNHMVAMQKSITDYRTAFESFAGTFAGNKK